MAFGSYDVQETAAPEGYDIDDSSVHSVAVNVNEDCSAATVPLELQFTDTPLTDLAIQVDSPVAGGTNSQITCKDEDDLDIGDSPSENIEHPTVNATDLHPGTYVCTVVVDP